MSPRRLEKQRRFFLLSQDEQRKPCKMGPAISQMKENCIAPTEWRRDVSDEMPNVRPNGRLAATKANLQAIC